MPVLDIIKDGVTIASFDITDAGWSSIEQYGQRWSQSFDKTGNPIPATLDYQMEMIFTELIDDLEARVDRHKEAQALLKRRKVKLRPNRKSLDVSMKEMAKKAAKLQALQEKQEKARVDEG